jgi:hypothetical protein
MSKPYRPLTARSAYATEAARSLRNAANHILAGRFEEAAHCTAAAGQCLTWLERHVKKVLERPTARKARRAVALSSNPKRFRAKGGGVISDDAVN